MEFVHSLLADQALYIGIVIGFAMRYLWCQIKVRWQDKYRPLPGGRRHARPRLNRSILGATLALGVVLFSLISVEDTSRRTDANTASISAMAHEAIVCENQRRAAAIADRDLQLQNDALAATERDLNAKETALVEDELTIVMDPPQDVADLHTTDPEYQTWSRQIKADYAAKLQAVRTERAAATAHREQVVAERAKHPVPEPTCGK